MAAGLAGSQAAEPTVSTAEGERMIEWLKDYYVDPSVFHPESVKKKIDQGRPPVGIYIITLSRTPGNLMEIMAAGFLRERGLRERGPKIIGMALGKDRALHLARKILEEVYEQTGGFVLTDYVVRTRG